MTWTVAAGSLPLGFGVAQATSVRLLGGLVLVAAAIWCALRWRRMAGDLRAAALLALYFGAFVASHLIADTVGAWGAVLLVAGAVGLVTWAVADRPSARRAATA